MNLTIFIKGNDQNKIKALRDKIPKNINVVTEAELDLIIKYL